VNPAGSGFPGFTLAYNTRNEAEGDAIPETAKDIGAHVVKPVRKTFWGGYGGYFADPDGFLREVAHNPFWKFDRKGNVKI
jgi:hypothetical protein